MACTDAFRRVVTLTVEGANDPETFAFTILPLADPLLTVSGAAGVSVDVDVSADGTAYAVAWGVTLGDAGAWWRVPRSAAAIRVSASGAAVFRLAILEPK